MNRLSDTCFVIPLRVDSPERILNLRIVLDFIVQHFDSEVTVLEADVEQRFFPDNTNSRIQYHFIEDRQPLFHRTKFLNRLYRMTNRPILAVWDTDMLLPPEQITKAAQQIREKKSVMAIPYDGFFYLTTPAQVINYQRLKDLNFLRENVRHTMNGQLSAGGAFLVDTLKYKEAGGENEHFTGWGPEDIERVKRMEILFPLPVYRSSGCAYHLWHPRVNSRYVDRQNEIINKQELLKICRMSKIELKKYIRSWSWKK